ncbi:hypothetical protein I6N91_15120 [Arthrobacter sp. MSA 4-2]|uniref:hypothetical protein n=1 Tax=Arthrobacter sp. MSA 4-2 TaxID=2794349 RepID=UPI0018E7AB93|nr:hypothetical protein [Arthrobacter sp. MSA 4-2]MBJ2122313.1 hypothetical protein [Arthrobacter sp. MSA 4-2]
MGTRIRRIRNDLRRKFAAHFYRLPLGLRRTAAVLFMLSITALMVVFYVGSYAQFKEAGETVRTQDHQSGLIVHIYDSRRNGNANYYVQTGEGSRPREGWQRVRYPEFLPNNYLYAEVEYVVDPEDPDSVIAVGTPEDWERMSASMLWLRVGMGVLSLGGIVMAWERLAPEDARVVWKRLFPNRKRWAEVRNQMPGSSPQ